MVRRGVLALAALALMSAPLSAQKPIELGIDAGLAFRVSDPTGWTFQLPTGHFRVGFPAGERVSIEPAVSISFDHETLSGTGGTSTSVTTHVVNADLGVLFHFKGATTGSRPYLRPFAGILSVGGGGNSASQFHVGAGIGVKLPMHTTRMAWRLEAGLEHGFHTDDFDSTTGIFVLFGISFFTR